MKRTVSLIIVIVMLILALVGCDSSDYKKAMALYEEGNYAAAAELFSGITDYNDSAEMLSVCRYAYAGELFDAGDYEQAVRIYDLIPDYKDSAERKAKAEREIMYSTYGEIFDLLANDIWFFNGGSDNSLNVLSFSRESATISNFFYDGNGKHSGGEKTCSYVIDDSYITIETSSGELEIFYFVEDGKIRLGNNEFYSSEEVDAELQGYWKHRYSDYIAVLYMLTEGEYNVLIDGGKITYESAAKAYGKPGQYYYYGPEKGTYEIGGEGFTNTAKNDYQWGINVIDGEVVLMYYDHPCERTDGFPGKNGYSFD